MSQSSHGPRVAVVERDRVHERIVAVFSRGLPAPAVRAKFDATMPYLHALAQEEAGFQRRIEAVRAQRG